MTKARTTKMLFSSELLDPLLSKRGSRRGHVRSLFLLLIPVFFPLTSSCLYPGEAEGPSTSRRILPVRRSLNRSRGPVLGEPLLGAESSKRAKTSKAVMPSHVSALPPPSQDGGHERREETSVVNPFQAIQASLDQVVTLAWSAEEMVREHKSALQAKVAEAMPRADSFCRLYEEAQDELARERSFNSTLAGRQAEALKKVKALEAELKVIGVALAEKTAEANDLRRRLSLGV